MKQNLFGKLYLCLVLIFGTFVFSANAQGDVTINGSIGNGKLERGKTATVTITMNIPGGLHINSSRPLNKYLIPTRIKLIGAGLRFGALNYPKERVKKFSFSNEPIAIYEGRLTIRATVTVPKDFKETVAKIRAVVGYQTCSDEVCYQPRSEEITLTTVVK